MAHHILEVYRTPSVGEQQVGNRGGREKPNLTLFSVGSVEHAALEEPTSFAA